MSQEQWDLLVEYIIDLFIPPDCAVDGWMEPCNPVPQPACRPSEQFRQAVASVQDDANCPSLS